MPRNSRLIYHGTNEKHLKNIRETGLHPRLSSGVSNYSGDVAGAFASHQDFLYLSSTRALVYGLAADGGRRVLLVEIPIERLEERRCYPDEDSIVLRQLVEEGTYEMPRHDTRFDELHQQARPEEHQLDWRSYFNEFGNIAYAGTIPFSSVTRYALVGQSVLKDAVLPVLCRFQPSSKDVGASLDFQAESIAFIFNADSIAGIPGEEMRRLRVMRLEHVTIRVV